MKASRAVPLRRIGDAAIVMLGLCVFNALAGATDWPGFRGPQRDGIVRGESIRTDWDDRPPRELWRRPIGAGWSGLTVVNAVGYTMEQRGDQEVTLAIDTRTGQEIWSRSTPGRFTQPFVGGGGDGPRATPTHHEGLLYSLGASGAFDCLDARTGKPIWSRNILQDAGATNVDYGMAGSPLVYRKTVVVNPGGPDGRGMMAYDRRTGVPVWGGGGGRAGYSSPTLARLHGVNVVLIFDSDGGAGYDANTGKELWRLPMQQTMTENCVQPIALADRYVMLSKHSETVLLELTAEEPTWRVDLVWRSLDLTPKFTDLIAVGQHAYGFDDDVGRLTCIDLQTGRKAWQGGRYGRGQLLHVNSHFIVLSDQGELSLAEATPEAYRPTHPHQVLTGTTWTPPTLVDGRLYVRNSNEIACFDVATR